MNGKLKLEKNAGCGMKLGKEAMMDMNEELMEVMKKVKDKEKFIRFLNFCFPRLNKDEPVQAIWNEWLQTDG